MGGFFLAFIGRYTITDTTVPLFQSAYLNLFLSTNQMEIQIKSNGKVAFEMEITI